MPEYLSPGVYIEEILGPQPIQGVSTSTTGMVGVTQKGPTAGKPVLLTSFADFRHQFGSYLDVPDGAERWELDDKEGGTWWRFPFAVKGFFDNGGQRLYVKRVVSSQATQAEAEISTSIVAARPSNTTTDPLPLGAPTGAGTPTNLLRAVAKAKGTWGNDISVRVRPDRARRIQAVHFDGSGPLATTLAAEVPAGANSAVINWPSRLGTVQGRVAVLLAGQRYEITAVPGPATTPNGPQVTLQLGGPVPSRQPSGTAVKILRQVDTDGQNGLRRIPLASTTDDAVYQNALLLIGPTEARATVIATPDATTAPGTVLVAPVATTTPLPAVFETDLVAVIEAALDVRYQAGASNPAAPRDEPEIIEEAFHALRLDKLSGTVNSIVDLVNANSNLVQLQVVENTPQPTVGWGVFPGSTEGYQSLKTGDDKAEALGPADFVGEDLGSGRRTGIQAMEDIEDISICAVPGMWSRTVQSALIGHCERLKDRFAILDAQSGLGVQDVQAFREPLDSNYAALYYPWLKVRDPVTTDEIRIPPSGHMAGLYAFVDNDRGVHKAPANVVIREIVGLDADVTQREQDVLNPVGINALREFPNRGLRVWGARTISSIPEWRYINVRRLFIFIEDSIKQGTQWVVFEPNAEPLWAVVTQAVTNFLDTVWRNGALEGIRQEEAFFVHCDRSTMTEDDIANGRLIIQIGIAPVKPAEFVIFRIRQKTRTQVAVA